MRWPIMRPDDRDSEKGPLQPLPPGPPPQMERCPSYCRHAFKLDAGAAAPGGGGGGTGAVTALSRAVLCSLELFYDKKKEKRKSR